jgi:hypothetical protein
MANAQLNVSFIENERGGQSLVYRFQVKNRRHESLLAVCSYNLSNNCVQQLSEHLSTYQLALTWYNHPANEAKKTLLYIKKRCREETTSVYAIYDQEIAKVRMPEWDYQTQRIVENLPTFPSCKTSLYHQRTHLIPNLPTTIDAIDLQDEWTTTTANERFLLVNDEGNNKITELRIILQRESQNS